MKINDWNSIQTLFDELNKRLDKVQKAPGSSGEPRKYIKMLVELEVGYFHSLDMLRKNGTHAHGLKLCCFDRTLWWRPLLTRM